MCVLAGCDYCPSLPGIGLKNAWRLVRDRGGLQGAIRQLRADGALFGSDSYPADALRAKQTFVYQRVWDPVAGRCVTLRPPEAAAEWGVEPPDLACPAASAFLGPHREPDVATAIARGIIHPETLRPYPGEDLAQVPRALLPAPPDTRCGTPNAAPTPGSGPFTLLKPQVVGSALVTSRPSGLQAKITGAFRPNGRPAGAPAAPSPSAAAQAAAPPTVRVAAAAPASCLSPRRRASEPRERLPRPAAGPASTTASSYFGSATSRTPVPNAPPSLPSPLGRRRAQRAATALPALHGVKATAGAAPVGLLALSGWGGERADEAGETGGPSAAAPPSAARLARPAQAPVSAAFAGALRAFAYGRPARSSAAEPAARAPGSPERRAPPSPADDAASPPLRAFVSPDKAGIRRAMALSDPPGSGRSVVGFSYSDCGSITPSRRRLSFQGALGVAAEGDEDRPAGAAGPAGSTPGARQESPSSVGLSTYVRPMSPSPGPTLARRAGALATVRRASGAAALQASGGSSARSGLDLSAFEYAPGSAAAGRKAGREAPLSVAAAARSGASRSHAATTPGPRRDLIGDFSMVGSAPLAKSGDASVRSRRDRADQEEDEHSTVRARPAIRASQRSLRPFSAPRPVRTLPDAAALCPATSSADVAKAAAVGAAPVHLSSFAKGAGGKAAKRARSGSVERGAGSKRGRQGAPPGIA